MRTTARTILTTLATLIVNALTSESSTTTPAPPRTSCDASSTAGRTRWAVELTIRAAKACC